MKTHVFGIVFLFALVAHQVNGIANVYGYLMSLRMNDQSGSLCHGGPCVARISICRSATSGSTERICDVYMSDNVVHDGEVQNYHFNSAHLEMLELDLPANYYLSAMAYIYNDGVEYAAAAEATGTFMINDNDPATIPAPMGITINGSNFDINSILVVRCSKGSMGPLCQCSSGSVEFDLTHAFANTNCGTAECSMIAIVCVSNEHDGFGKCESFKSTATGSLHDYAFSNAAVPVTNFDYGSTLYVTIILEQWNAGSLTGSSDPIYINTNITNDGWTMHSMDAISALGTTWKFDFNIHGTCQSISDGLGDDCFGDTIIRIHQGLSDDPNFMCMNGPCFLQVHACVYEYYDDMICMEFTSDTYKDGTSESTVNSFTFESAEVLSLVHAMPAYLHLNVSAKLWDKDMVFTGEDFHAWIHIGEMGEGEVDMHSMIDDHNYTISVQHETMGIHGEFPSEAGSCHIGFVDFEFDQVNVRNKTTDKTGMCPDGDYCQLILKISADIESFDMPMEGIFRADNFVFGGEDLKFYFSHVIFEVADIPLPVIVSYTISIHMKVLEIGTSDMGIGGEAILVGAIPVGREEAKKINHLLPSDPEEIYSFVLKGDIKSHCGRKVNHHRIKGECVKYEVAAKLLGATREANCSGVVCTLLVKFCIGHEHPGNETCIEATSDDPFMAWDVDHMFHSIKVHMDTYSEHGEVEVYYYIHVYDIVDGIVHSAQSVVMGEMYLHHDHEEAHVYATLYDGHMLTLHLSFHRHCLEGSIHCPERDHYKCEGYHYAKEYYCKKFTDVCHKYCPYMCGVCEHCDRPHCFEPVCHRSSYGCRYDVGDHGLPSVEECKELGVCGRDHAMCQTKYHGPDHFHPCHRCKYEQYAKLCPITCGLCPLPCGGKTCQNKGTLNPDTCDCCCTDLFSGEHCEELMCPPDEEDDCDWPLWYCDEFPVPKECAFHCCLCEKKRRKGKK